MRRKTDDRSSDRDGRWTMASQPRRDRTMRVERQCHGVRMVVDSTLTQFRAQEYQQHRNISASNSKVMWKRNGNEAKQNSDDETKQNEFSFSKSGTNGIFHPSLR
ncbi:hypothetical protein AGOR_G00251600 [Albula goreensis]|uniref:Uncharacterized protein n=1 Tax=Albula goreensis TaxID=1534307 RepID=A0A8T3CF72_9TELE|nr:hypothetical protein AGOR_G00251600 [Albula goreensis]